jgi:uncharacterized membrane protein YkoI
MKSWQLRMMGMTMISCLALQIGPAWANTGSTATDGITRHIQNHPYHQRHTPAVHRTLEPVTADIQSTDAENSMHHWDIRSSVQVSRDALRDAYVASRDAYTKKLKKYAKCTEKDAEKAVSAEHPGMKVQDIQLRNIRTSLVYMAVVADDEEKFLVVVDAGNGKILMDKPMPTHHEKVFAEH